MNKHHNMKDYMIAKKKKFLFKKTLATKIKLLVRLLLIPPVKIIKIQTSSFLIKEKNK